MFSKINEIKVVDVVGDSPYSLDHAVDQAIASVPVPENALGVNVVKCSAVRKRREQGFRVELCLAFALR